MRAAVDHDKAQRQWEELWLAFREAGLQVETIDPVRNLEDVVFAAPVFVGHHAKIGRFIVPAEMKYPSRQREVPRHGAGYPAWLWRISCLCRKLSWQSPLPAPAIGGKMRSASSEP